MKKCKILVKVEKIKLEDNLFWPHVGTESLWGELLNGDTATVTNVPFYAKGIGFLDEVAVIKETEEIFRFLRVIKHSGRSTIRALLMKDDEDALAVAEKAIGAVEALGCSIEWGGEVAAIDVPQGVSTQAVVGALTPAKERGVLFVDIGFLADHDGRAVS